LLAARRTNIAGWVAAGRALVKIHERLTRSGLNVPYRTVHQFATALCGLRPQRSTVRVADGILVWNARSFRLHGFHRGRRHGRRRNGARANVPAVFSGACLYTCAGQQWLADMIAGCEATWAYFGGVFKVVMPDNLTPVVTDEDPVNPRLSTGWSDYSQHLGFVNQDPPPLPTSLPRTYRACRRRTWARSWTSAPIRSWSSCFTTGS